MMAVIAPSARMRTSRAAYGLIPLMLLRESRLPWSHTPAAKWRPPLGASADGQPRRLLCSRSEDTCRCPTIGTEAREMHSFMTESADGTRLQAWRNDGTGLPV